MAKKSVLPTENKKTAAKKAAPKKAAAKKVAVKKTATNTQNIDETTEKTEVNTTKAVVKPMPGREDMYVIYEGSKQTDFVNTLERCKTQAAHLNDSM